MLETHVANHQDNYPLTLSGEEKNALAWRIRLDYACARMQSEGDENGGTKDAYITFAFNFYIRSRQSIDDIVMQYRMHFREVRAKLLAEAFMNDILHKMRNGNRVTEAA